MIDLIQFKDAAEKAYKTNKQLVKHLKKKPKKQLDEIFQENHNLVFDQLDCLQCANCCKTTSPIFYVPDIERLAKSLKIKPAAFIDTYLKLDEDNDYVLKSSPCPFLGFSNKCIVYENRPKACKEYPHTNRKRVYQILNLTLKNTMVCPATLEILNKIKAKL